MKLKVRFLIVYYVVIFELVLDLETGGWDVDNRRMAHGFLDNLLEDDITTSRMGLFGFGVL